jgi:hypothetical protein
MELQEGARSNPETLQHPMTSNAVFIAAFGVGLTGGARTNIHSWMFGNKFHTRQYLLFPFMSVFDRNLSEASSAILLFLFIHKVPHLFMLKCELPPP